MFFKYEKSVFTHIFGRFWPNNYNFRKPIIIQLHKVLFLEIIRIYEV